MVSNHLWKVPHLSRARERARNDLSTNRATATGARVQTCPRGRHRGGEGRVSIQCIESFGLMPSRPLLCTRSVSFRFSRFPKCHTSRSTFVRGSPSQQRYMTLLLSLTSSTPAPTAPTLLSNCKVVRRIGKAPVQLLLQQSSRIPMARSGLYMYILRTDGKDWPSRLLLKDS